MKQLKRILSLTLCILLTAALMTGCGSREGSNRQASLVGTWEYKINFTELIALVAEETGAFAEGENYIEVLREAYPDLSVAINMTFHKDGTFLLVLPEQSLKELGETIIDGKAEFIYHLIEAYLRDENIDITVEEYLETENTTIDELADVMNMEEDLTEMMELYSIEDFSMTAFYTAGNGKLRMSNNSNSKNEGVAIEYSVKRDTLILDVDLADVDTSDLSQESELVLRMIFPMELTRID